MPFSAVFQLACLKTIELNQELEYVVQKFFRLFFGAKMAQKRTFRADLGHFSIFSCDMSKNIKIEQGHRI